jgi:diguanylate cyclase (GGDEF)-like protein
MLSLDLRSLIIMSGIMSLMMAVVLAFMRMGYPRSIRGLGLWAGAPALVALSTLMFAGRGALPDAISILGANLMLLSGIALYYFGAERFYGRPISWRLWGGVLLALVPLLGWYTLVEPDYNVRVLLVSLTWAAMMLSLAWLIWRQGRAVFSTRFAVVLAVMHGGVLLLRFVSAWMPLPEEGLLTPTSIQTLYVAVNAFMTLALSVALILMAGDRLREEFEQLAARDALTNVLTRRAFLAACEQELARCRRYGRSMALLLLDIDHFKAVNDTYGHQTGDRVLVDFVGRIQSLLRQPDLLARFGGEEFVVLLPETKQDEAVAVAERILAEVAAPHDGVPAITVSIGVATNRPDEMALDTVLARADKALYKAKAEGRNRVEVA